jgi:hypothetical protein
VLFLLLLMHCSVSAAKAADSFFDPLRLHSTKAVLIAAAVP